MQRLSLQSERTLRRSVNQVSQYRMSDACHMNTDLMCPSCFQFTFDMRVVSKNVPAPDSASLPLFHGVHGRSSSCGPSDVSRSVH